LLLVAGGLLAPDARKGVGARGQSSFIAALGELAACALAARPLGGTLGFCAGVQGGAIWGQSQGLWRQRQSQQAVLQAMPSARTQLPIFGWVSLQAAIGATFPLISPGYSYLDEAGTRRHVYGVQMGVWAEVGAAIRLF
jgi:hypothetical protein